MQNQIPIVFCFDANFAPYAGVATYSLHLNSKSALKVYWLVPAEDLDDTRLIRKNLKKFDIDISIIGVDERRFSKWKITHHISRATYLRLLIPNLIEESKVIYLDGDTLVLSDLSELYATDLRGSFIGGVAASGGGKSSKVPRTKGDVYINAGVLLLDLDGLRKDDFMEKCDDIYLQYRDSITWLEQCIINKYADGNKVVVEKKWNRQLFTQRVKYDQWKKLISNNDSSVIHFLGGIKPWMEWCNPYIAKYWWQYANQVGFKNFEPVKMNTVDHALKLSRVLDLNEKFEDSNAVKGDIIEALLNNLDTSKRKIKLNNK